MARSAAPRTRAPSRPRSPPLRCELPVIALSRRPHPQRPPRPRGARRRSCLLTPTMSTRPRDSLSSCRGGRGQPVSRRWVTTSGWSRLTGRPASSVPCDGSWVTDPPGTVHGGAVAVADQLQTVLPRPVGRHRAVGQGLLAVRREHVPLLQALDRDPERHEGGLVREDPQALPGIPLLQLQQHLPHAQDDVAPARAAGRPVGELPHALAARRLLRVLLLHADPGESVEGAQVPLRQRNQVIADGPGLLPTVGRVRKAEPTPAVSRRARRGADWSPRRSACPGAAGRPARPGGVSERCARRRPEHPGRATRGRRGR